ncbi:phosphatidylethanolamine-binding protein [Peziza echinospora]|nr:phosphatidylethanolamine-binding protein [Peziza echinospora]
MASRTPPAQCIARVLSRPTVCPRPFMAAIPQVRGVRTAPNKAPTTDDVKRKKGFVRTIEKMPFQTYQLALEVIAKDREQKIKEIALEKQRLALAIEKEKGPRVVSSLQRHIERLKVLVDINNPRVKYNFDNDIAGPTKPVYRFLLDRKWREMRRPVLMQRITQMKVIPDVLPFIDPVVDVQVRFSGRDVKPGTILNTLRTEKHPSIKIIPFKPGEMLCTIAVVDSDVPDAARDRYTYRLHWLVSNIPISHLKTQAIGTTSPPSDTIVSYLPPHVQKGIPYHRYSLFVFKQSEKIDAQALEGKVKREVFIMRSFQAKHNLEPIGVFMWRNEWDQYTSEVMKRHDLPGHDIMWRNVKA